MQSNLKEKLWAFIIHNNPELMFNLQAEYSVTRHLEDKVAKVMPFVLKLLEQGKSGPAIEELALEAMTEELRPSRFLYLKGILKNEFPAEYESYKEAGVLTYETVNLIDHCQEVFDVFAFSVENEQDQKLRHAIIAKVHDYLP